MRMTYVSQELDRVEFAKKAAEYFAKDPKNRSYGELTPGSLIGIRWGMGDDCVLVLKLDEDFEPVNFQQAVKHVEP